MIFQRLGAANKEIEVIEKIVNCFLCHVFIQCKRGGDTPPLVVIKFKMLAFAGGAELPSEQQEQRDACRLIKADTCCHRSYRLHAQA